LEKRTSSNDDKCQTGCMYQVNFPGVYPTQVFNILVNNLHDVRVNVFTAASVWYELQG